MTTAEMHYIGVCALLGRLSSKIKDEEALVLIEAALNDCAEQFPGRFEVVKVTNGWSLEPK